MAEDCREKIISNDYIDFVLDFPLEEIFGEEGVRYDYCYQQVDSRIGILSINRNQLPDTSLLSNDYMSFPDILGLQQEMSGQGEETAQTMLIGQTDSRGEQFNPSPLIQSGITQVQDARLNLTGRGVILAFADTGINYRNRVFRNADGSTRILAIWDQTIQDGEPPEGFLYGTEYTREEIDRALQAEGGEIDSTVKVSGNGNATIASNKNVRALDIVPSMDENGHGTRLAALAGGSRLGEGSIYNSPAFQADIVVVKLKPAKEYLREYYQIPDGASAYSSTDMMMAIKYLDSFARVFRRPVIFCLGMGTNFRDHESGDVFSRYLNAVASKRSRIMVITGGNEGNASHHYRGRFPDGNGGNRGENSGRNASLEESMEVYVSEGVDGFLMEVWTEAPVNLAVSIRTPGGEYIEPTSVLFQTNLRYRFVFEETIITVYNAYITQGSGDALVLMRFENPTPGIWTIGVLDENRVADARFDAWLPISEFLQQPVYFLRPNPDTTMTTPAYVEDAITTATYNSFNNSIYRESGRGFSRDDRIKPDIAVPGVDLTIAGNRLGEEPVISTYTGASLAAAMMAGAAAQFAQWAVVDENAPYIRSREVKNYFIRGASRDRNIDYPNEIWGWGRLNLYNTFVEMEP